MFIDTGIGRQVTERAQRQGVTSLTDAELLALILAGTSQNGSELEAASRLLRDCQGLSGFGGLRSDSQSLQRLGEERAGRLLALLELGRRLARAVLPERDPMSHPAAVARYLGLRFSSSGQEVMGALYLDSRNRLMAVKEIYRGTLNRAAVEPRGVLKEGLLQDAAAFVLFHTHPSGDPSPSAEDLAFTRRIAQSGELVGIRLVDHLILGRGHRWVSLRQRGGW